MAQGPHPRHTCREFKLSGFYHIYPKEPTILGKKKKKKKKGGGGGEEKKKEERKKRKRRKEEEEEEEKHSSMQAWEEATEVFHRVWLLWGSVLVGLLGKRNYSQ